MLSKWYKKDEYGLRTCLLYCGSLISNALGPLIAAGILGGMEGEANIRAWRWLCRLMMPFVTLGPVLTLRRTPSVIVEGALTIFFGFVCYFVRSCSASGLIWY